MLRTKRYLLLSAGMVYLRETKGLWPRRLHASSPVLMADVDYALSQLNKTRLQPELHVLLGSGYCRFLVIDRPAGMTDADEALAIASAELARRLGLKIAEWQIQVDNHSRTQIMACAIRKETAQTIQNWANAAGHQLMSMQPLITTLPKHLCGPLGYCILEPDAIALAGYAQRKLQRKAALMSLPAIGDTPLALERLLLNANVDAAEVHVYKLGNAPGNPRRDFSDLYSEVRS